MNEREQLEQAIAHLESQRVILGEAVVEASVAALREKLTALVPSLTQQRKQVTLLFADVSGFTAVAGMMDPEEITDLMNSLWQDLDAIIVQHGGSIDKHIGDAVMALWGREEAREDDPERAVRAALAMQAALAMFHDAHQLKLSMRIGLNTGPVLLGEVGSRGEYTAMGDVVNMASRLEQAAPVGGVLISHETYQHVRGLVEVQSLAPLSVKGKAEPLQVYLVQRMRPAAFRMGRRGLPQIDTSMIGRTAELQQLQDTLTRTMTTGQRQMITIVGEIGVGKSRLLYEFERRLGRQPEVVAVFKGRANQEIQNLPYGLLRTLFIFQFQIMESDRAEIARQKLEQGLATVLGDTERGRMQAHFIGHLLGFDFSHSLYLRGVLDDTRQIRDRALTYLTAFFSVVTRQYPTLFFLDDLHWADESSLAALEHVITKIGQHPLLIIGLTRPNLLERRPSWGKDQDFHRQLVLQPLSQAESRRLVREILRKVDRVPPELQAKVVERAEGNPYYVEELIKMLIEERVIVPDQPHWRIAQDRLAELTVPSTLTGILQARLDSLSLSERITIQQASVIGRVFWDDAVVHMNGADVVEEIDQGDIPSILSSLNSKEMIFQRAPASFAGAQEYIFKHTVLRDVTYESVLKRLRRIYHALAAEWLIAQSKERAIEYAGLIADHLVLAGELNQATRYLRQAGRHAAGQFANVAAVTFFSRALDIVPEQKLAERYEILLAREKVFDLQGERENQWRDLLALNNLAEALDDPSKRAEIALRQANYRMSTSDYPGAISIAQSVMALAQSVSETNIEAQGQLVWGQALRRQGHYEQAKAQLRLALDLARETPVEGMILNNLGIIAAELGDYGSSRMYFEQSLVICRQTGNQKSEGDALNNLGIVVGRQGDYEGAKQYYEQALHLKQEIGDRQGEAMVIDNLGGVFGYQGDYSQAKVYFEESLIIRREVGDREGESNELNNLGNVAAYQGDYLEARRCYERSLQIRREIGDRWGEGEGIAYLSLLFHQHGDDQTAFEYGEQAVRIARKIGHHHLLADALTHLGHSLAALGQMDQATIVYQEAVTIRRELGEDNRAMETLAGLVRVALSRNEIPQTQRWLEEILAHLETNTLDGTEEPFRIYLTCYRTLVAHQDVRADDILAFSYRLLQDRAAKITDPEMRFSFLENVAAHRELIAAFETS